MDLKLVKSIGEHHVAAELARRGWAPALTRDGLERTDLLAVHTEGADRRLVEIQVKTARGTHWDSISWPLVRQVTALDKDGLNVYIAPIVRRVNA